MSETFIDDLRADVAARLAADEYFTDIPVLTERTGDIAAEIQKRLGTLTTKGGKMGICAVILQVAGRVEHPNVPGPCMRLHFAIRVLENVLINTGASGTGKPASAVARRIQKVLHQYSHPALSALIMSEKDSLDPVADPLAQVAYEVKFSTNESDTDPVLKCSVPVITPNSGTHPATITMMASATSSATITYTLDGSAPYAPNSNAIVWTGAPVAITAACTVRAVASKTGYISSNAVTAIFT